ncbi:11602_t:CDS:1, partial [Cetraspora pellucida]
MPNAGSFPHSFPSKKLGGASKNAPQPSTPGGENNMKAPPNPAEAMLPHSQATNQPTVDTTSQHTQPKTASPPKTSVATTSSAPKPSGSATTSSSNSHVINGIGLYLMFASGVI